VYRFQIPQTHEEEGQDLRITEEDLRTAIEKCDPRRAAGVEGAPGEIVRIIAEQQPRRLLDLFNNINRSERIAAVWRVAIVMLLQKPAKDPLLSSLYRPISILPELSKVWENTFKSAIEKELGMDSNWVSQEKRYHRCHIAGLQVCRYLQKEGPSLRYDVHR
jgi:hypothetical protein